MLPISGGIGGQELHVFVLSLAVIVVITLLPSGLQIDWILILPH